MPFLAGVLIDTERGFQQMNESLKARAEGIHLGDYPDCWGLAAFVINALFPGTRR